MKLVKSINKIIKGLLFVNLLMFSFSCEDFLKEEAISDISADYIYNTPDGLEAGVVGLYKFNREIYENGAHEWFSSIMMAARSDLALNRGGRVKFIWFIYLGNKSGRLPGKSIGIQFLETLL